MKLIKVEMIEISVRGHALHLNPVADALMVDIFDRHEGVVDVEGPEQAEQLERLLASVPADWKMSVGVATDDDSDVFGLSTVAEFGDWLASQVSQA
jgi:hypothetical protein